MNDNQIVDLYWTRSEKAIEETEHKFGSYCRTVSYNILANTEDAEECVNDMLMSVWDSIPPHLPMSLQAYLITLVRRSAIDKAKHEHRQKRRTTVCALPLDELAEIIPSGEQLESVVEQRELVQVLMAFLDMLKPQARHIFMQRYFMTESFQTIAEANHISENAVKMSLSRTRRQLRDHLGKEGLL